MPSELVIWREINDNVGESSIVAERTATNSVRAKLDQIADDATTLGDITVRASFVTETNQTFFWSGLGRGGDKVAAEIAGARGGLTLKQLTKARGIELPPWDAANPASVQACQSASRAYAENARMRCHTADIFRHVKWNIDVVGRQYTKLV